VLKRSIIFISCLFIGQLDVCEAYGQGSSVATLPSGSKDVPVSQGSAGSIPKPTFLKGRAEVTQHGDSNLESWQASQMYKQGVAFLSVNNLGQAAECFKLAGQGFLSSMGEGKFLAESLYAEAQARRLLGQKAQAAILYQKAALLFQRYDPLSPYLKASMDNQRKVAPKLKAKLARNEFKLNALKLSNGIQSVDRNVILKGRVTDSESDPKLLSEKGVTNVPDSYVRDTVLKAFVRMTCLETADLGSNYYTAADRYVPLKAHGKTVALAASSDFLTPVIDVRINGHFYNVSVDLPGLTANRRTVLLITDGRNILAIDPGTYDVWKMNAAFNKRGADFSWKKLTHYKGPLHRIDE